MGVRSFNPLRFSMGYIHRLRRSRQRTEYDAAYLAYSLKKSFNNYLEDSMINFGKTQTPFEVINNTLKTFSTELLEFEFIANHDVHVLAVPKQEAINLKDGDHFIISCHSASLLAVKTGAIESSLERHFIIVKFNLITLRECTDWESVVLD